jgi:plastocyanin
MRRSVVVLMFVAGLGVVPEARGAEREFYVLAVEPKGSASVKKESFPAVKLPEGKGFEMKAPDKAGTWQVSAYVFVPAQIFVRRGDDVTLHFVGINGDKHTIHIDTYKTDAFRVRRGGVQTIRFRAEKAGVFKFLCDEHPPSMRGELVVQGD